MPSDQAKSVLDILDAVLELPPADQAAFLEKACAGNYDLLEEVKACIKAENPAQWQPLIQVKPAPFERKSIGPYLTLKELGSGGMGTVYLAERGDQAYDQQVAIKVLKRGMDTQHFVQRFQAERQILARLDHPNIAKLFDGGTTEDGLPFLVMEYIEGTAIDQYCLENKLGIPQRLALFQQVCSALAYAHENLVVHRDIKPSNILISKAGIPKLLDFGIAKLLHPQATDPPTQTAPAQQLMTFEYSSPEQLRGEPAKTSQDVYGLGLLLYELLCGERPFRFRGTTPQAFMQLICEKDPEKPSQVIANHMKRGSLEALGASLGCSGDLKKWQRELKGDLDNISLRALQKAPQDRYESVMHFSEDLSRHKNHLPVLAKKQPTLVLVRKFIQRNRLGVAVGVAFATTCLLFSLHILAQRNGLRAERERVLQERDKSEQRVNFLVTLFSVPEPLVPREKPITAQEILDRGAGKLQRDSYTPDTKAHLATMLGVIYRGIGLFDQSKPLLEQGLSLNQALRGDTHPDSVLGLNELGNLYQIQGNYDKAQQTLQQALEKGVFLPEDSPAITQTYLSFAANARARGDYAQAVIYGQKALSRQKEFLEPNHPDIAANLSQLGLVRQRQGQFDEAIALFHEAMAMAKKSSGNRDAHVNRIVLNLASVYQDKNDLPNAETYYRQGIAWQKKNLGPRHPETSVPLNNFATLLLKMGKFRAAETQFMETLTLAQKIYGENSPLEASILHNLSGLYHLQGEFDKAEQILHKIIKIDRENLGDEHPYLASSLAFLGWIKAEKGDYPQAETLYQEALAMILKTLGKNHPDYALQLGNYGMVFKLKGEFAKAEPILRESLAITENLFEKQNLQIVTAKNRLIVLKLAMQAFEEAESLALEALAILEGQLSQPNRLIVRTETHLAVCLIHRGAYQNAETLLLENYGHSQSFSGGMSQREGLQILPKLIELYQRWEKPQQAKHYQSLLEQIQE